MKGEKYILKSNLTKYFLSQIVCKHTIHLKFDQVNELKSIVFIPYNRLISWPQKPLYLFTNNFVNLQTFAITAHFDNKYLYERKAF